MNLYLDVETTSFHKTYRRPWELAFINEENDSVIYHVEDLLLDGHDPESLNKSGFHRRYDKDTGAIILKERIIALSVQMLTMNKDLVGCATWFDAAILEEMLERHNLKPQWKKVICVQALVSEKVGSRVQGLAKCADLVNVDYDDRLLHSALGDAELAKKIYEKVTK